MFARRMLANAGMSAYLASMLAIVAGTVVAFASGHGTAAGFACPALSLLVGLAFMAAAIRGRTRAGPR